MKPLFLSFFTASLSFLFLNISIPETRKQMPAASSPTDSMQVKAVIISFVAWYKQHYRQIHQEALTYQDQQGYYQVNIPGTERYLTKLKSSGFISDEYLANWRQYFESRAMAFKENPQSEGPPEGFDYDLVLLTQEPELLWDKIHEVTFSWLEYRRDFAVVKVNGTWPHVFELRKAGKNWLIDFIYIAEPD